MSETTKTDEERAIAKQVVDEEFVVRVHRRLGFVSWFVLEPLDICRAVAEEAIIAWEALKES